MRQFKRIVFVAVAIAALTVGLPASARSATHVVHPGQSIQAAVDAASPGDTVVVKTGEYYESVTIHTNGLTLKAQGEVTLEPSHYGSSECYLPNHDVGICVTPASTELGDLCATGT